jgi:cell pole-organizing protein PopZ
MSGVTTGEARQGAAAPVPPASVTAADPSMEDILASIRRILSEDEKAPPSGSHPAEAPAAAPADVLVLDETMLVEAPPHDHAGTGAGEAPAVPPPASIEADLAELILAQSAQQAEAAGPPPAPVPPAPDPEPHVTPALDSNMPDLMSPEASEAPAAGHRRPPAPSEPLVAPESAAATQSVVAGLMRQLSSERATPIYRAGPSIEDLVREEMRPLLAHWLDTHLPPMVERLVRAELDRVIARAAP